MAKRANGEGTIRKRADGRWEGRYYDPIEDKQKSIYRKTQKEVREELDKIAVDKDIGRVILKTDMTLDEWVDFYIENYKEGYIKPQSVNAIRYKYKNHIQPYLGSKKIAQITEIDVRQLLRQLSDKYANNTAAQTKGCLTGILEQAMRNKLIKENPSKYVKMPQNLNETKPKRELTDYEIYWFFRGLSECCTSDVMYFELLLTTGARRGEILALKWQDISEDYSYLVIDETYVEYFDYKSNTRSRVVNTPKTKDSIRIIPIQEEIKARLKYAKDTAIFIAKQFNREFAESNFIFANPRTGKIINSSHVDTVIRTVRDYLKREYNLELPKITAHYFRHTFASRALREGVSLETLKELLGHSDFKMIGRIYAHSSNTDKEKAINKMFASMETPLGSDCGQRVMMMKN